MSVKNKVNSYHAEVDSVGESQWNELVTRFLDASIYQTWPAASVQCGDNKTSRILIRKNEEVISIAQVGIKKVPFIPLRIANIHWGPLWRVKNRVALLDDLQFMLEIIKREYAFRRHLLIRIWPNEVDTPDKAISRILKYAGYIFNPSVPQNRTLKLDIRPSIDELRQNLERKWRQALGRAERFPSLSIECGTSEHHYRIALSLYDEMHQRKQFFQFVDMEAQGRIQKGLPKSLKMKIAICRLSDEPIAALGWSTIGDTALPLIAATGYKSVSLSTNASNLLWWRMVEDAKRNGCNCLDLGGIDPIKNPGGFKFKSGLTGKNGKDEIYMGQYYFGHDYKNRILNILKMAIKTKKRLSNFRK